MAERVGTAPAGPLKEWIMMMDIACQEGRCKHCGSNWIIGHDCKPKRLAQRAYRERLLGNTPPTQRRSLQEDKDITDAKLASLKDKVVLLSRQLALSKENGT